MYYVLFGKVVTRRDRKKMSKRSNPWGPEKKNQSLKAIPGIQMYFQESVPQKALGGTVP